MNVSMGTIFCNEFANDCEFFFSNQQGKKEVVRGGEVRIAKHLILVFIAGK